MRHARPFRRRARRTTSVVAASAIAALLLSACGGEPEAQETVGPTAGAPSPTSEQSYEPTLPPYTSDVELSDEATAQVEETLQAINEYILFSSTTSDEGAAGIDQLANANKISSGLRDAYVEMKDEADQDGLSLSGEVQISEMAVWEHTPDDSGYYGFCLEFKNWGLVDPATGLDGSGEAPPASRTQLAELQAEFDDGAPVLQNLRFDAPENECKNL